MGDALKRLTASVPRLAVPVATQWANRSTTVYAQSAADSWVPIQVSGGVIQGFVEAQPIFCVVLAELRERVLADPVSALHDDPHHIDWAYIDDWTLQPELRRVPLLHEAILRHAGPLGFALQSAKCQVHVPAHADTPRDQWPEELATANAVMPVSPSGLTLLGTEVTAAYETTLAADAASTKAAERLAKARRLADRLLEVLALVPPAGAKHPVWTMNRCVVAQALSYDFRVLPCAIAAPHAKSLEESVTAVASAILATPIPSLTHTQRTQVHLPVRCAGLQLIRPSRVAPLARAAALIEGGPVLRRTLASWPDCNEQQACLYDGVDADVAAGLPALLAAEHIHAFAGDGTAAELQVPVAPPAAGPVDRAGLTHSCQAAADLRPPAPARHLLSAFLRTAADTEYAALLAEATPAAAIRLRSAAGPTAGASLVAPLSTAGVHYTDEELDVTFRRRLGVVPVGPVVQHGQHLCQNWNATRGKICGAILDTDGNHAATCPCGPLTNFCHDGLADRWCDCLEETGLCTRRELFVPALCTPQKEAWLDIGTFGPGELGQQLFDVTVRHPAAARYEQAAANSDGATASRGDRDKNDRYGDLVTPLVHESWGRLNDSAESLLDSAAASAARLDWRRGRPPGHRLQRWRAQLDADLQRAQARMQLAAVNGMPGRPHRRLLPVDLATLQTHGAWPPKRG